MSQDFEEWLRVTNPADELDPTGMAPAGTLAFFRRVFAEHGPVGLDEVRAHWFERQIALSRKAADLFAADVRATTDLQPPPFDYRVEAEGVRLVYWGSYATTTVMEITDAEVTREVSDFMQEEVVEELHGGWPTCPDHSTGAYAHIVDGVAVWYCRQFKHAIARIGNLAP